MVLYDIKTQTLFGPSFFTARSFAGPDNEMKLDVDLVEPIHLKDNEITGHTDYCFLKHENLFRFQNIPCEHEGPLKFSFWPEEGNGIMLFRVFNS
jgi:hypothetical protein